MRNNQDLPERLILDVRTESFIVIDPFEVEIEYVPKVLGEEGRYRSDGRVYCRSCCAYKRP